MIPLPQRRVSKAVRVCAFIQVWVLSLSVSSSPVAIAELRMTLSRSRQMLETFLTMRCEASSKKCVGEGSGQRGSKIGCYIECIGAILASVGVNVGW